MVRVLPSQPIVSAAVLQRWSVCVPVPSVRCRTRRLCRCSTPPRSPRHHGQDRGEQWHPQRPRQPSGQRSEASAAAGSDRHCSLHARSVLLVWYIDVVDTMDIAIRLDAPGLLFARDRRPGLLCSVVRLACCCCLLLPRCCFPPLSRAPLCSHSSPAPAATFACSTVSPARVASRARCRARPTSCSSGPGAFHSMDEQVREGESMPGILLRDASWACMHELCLILSSHFPVLFAFSPPSFPFQAHCFGLP